MKKSKISYDKKKDILYIMVSEGVEESFEDISKDITVEYDSRGKLIGIEIFNASKVIPSTKIASHITDSSQPHFASE